MGCRNTRIILTADLHTGSSTGLTTNPQNKIQEKILDLYNNTINHFGPKPDYVIVNGDAIQGCSARNKDIVNATAVQQAVEAAKVIYKWGATKEYIIIGGTGFHTEVDGEDIDRFVCGELERLLRADKNFSTKVSYHDKLKTTFNGWFRLEARHRIGTSTIPHGRATAPSKAKMWNALSSALTGGALTHLYVYAHAHYYQRVEDDLGCALILPCWQALGNKFGTKICDGIITLGASQLTIGEKNKWELSTKRYLPSVTNRWESR